MNERGWLQRLLLWSLGALLVVGVTLFSIGGAGAEHDGSIASARADGRRAMFLFLRELGFRPRAWNQAPLALPEGEHLLWLADAPFEVRPDEELESGDLVGEGVDPSLADPRHPRHYARFVRNGGTLVLPASAGLLDWLAQEARIELPPWSPARSESGALRVVLETGEELAVSADLDALEGQPIDERDPAWRALAVDEGGRPFAASYRVAEGRVVLLADDGFLENGSLGEEDHGVLLVRLIEALDRGGELLFDEYALGLWVPPSSAGLLFAPGLREVTLHAILFALALVLCAAWVREFPRDPDPVPLNPRLRARSQARLLERASRHDLLGRELRLGVLRRLARQFRLSQELTRLREDAQPEAIAEVARQVAALAGCGKQADEWAALFASGGERRRGDLKRLSEALADIEHVSEMRSRGAGRERRKEG